MSKGDKRRPYDKPKYDNNYDNIKWSKPELTDLNVDDLINISIETEKRDIPREMCQDLLDIAEKKKK